MPGGSGGGVLCPRCSFDGFLRGARGCCEDPWARGSDHRVAGAAGGREDGRPAEGFWRIRASGGFWLGKESTAKLPPAEASRDSGALRQLPLPRGLWRTHCQPSPSCLRQGTLPSPEAMKSPRVTNLVTKFLSGAAMTAHPPCQEEPGGVPRGVTGILPSATALPCFPSPGSPPQQTRLSPFSGQTRKNPGRSVLRCPGQSVPIAPVAGRTGGSPADLSRTSCCLQPVQFAASAPPSQGRTVPSYFPYVLGGHGEVPG